MQSNKEVDARINWAEFILKTKFLISIASVRNRCDRTHNFEGHLYLALDSLQYKWSTIWR